MATSVAVWAGMVRANGLEFGVLEAGSGPLALCLHVPPGTRRAAETGRRCGPAGPARAADRPRDRTEAVTRARQLGLIS